MKIRTALALVATGSFLMLAAGCATSIPIQVKKPAELDIPPVKRVAVADFDMTGSWQFWYDNNKDMSFQDLAKKVIMQKLGMENSTRPDPKTAFPGTEYSNRLISGLVQNGHYQVMERAELKRIMSEQGLNQTGAFDESKAAQVGKLAGVEAMIIGSGTYSISDGGAWIKVTEKRSKTVTGADGKPQTVVEEVQVQKYEARRDVSMNVTFRVVEIATSRVVASKTNTNSVRLTSRDNSEEGACKSLPDWNPSVSNLAGGLVTQTVRQVAPYFVTQSRTIAGGKTPGMKTALDYAKRGMLDDAKTLWEEAEQLADPKLVKDRIGAIHNLGVYAEVNGDLDKAEERFNTCYKMTGKGSYLDERMRIQNRRKELERLKKQGSEATN